MIVMDLNLGGKAFDTRRAEWLDTPNRCMLDSILKESAVPDEVFALLFEVYAGHYYPGRDGCTTVLGRSTFGIWQEDAYQLWLDVSTLQFLLHLTHRSVEICQAWKKRVQGADLDELLAPFGDGDPCNSWTGELYFSAHRCSCTSQAAIKRNTPRSECAMWGTAAMCKGGSHPLSDTDRLWKQVLPLRP